MEGFEERGGRAREKRANPIVGRSINSKQIEGGYGREGTEKSCYI